MSAEKTVNTKNQLWHYPNFDHMKVFGRMNLLDYFYETKTLKLWILKRKVIFRNIKLSKWYWIWYEEDKYNLLIFTIFMVVNLNISNSLFFQICTLEVILGLILYRCYCLHNLKRIRWWSCYSNDSTTQQHAIALDAKIWNDCTDVRVLIVLHYFKYRNWIISPCAKKYIF